MSDVVEFLASRLRSLTPEKWDAFVRSLDQRFRVLEEQLGIERRVTDQILQRGLQVIEDGIGPAIIQAEQAADNVAAMADLGLVFFATSSTSMTINTNVKSLTIPASSRAQFAPAAYVLVTAGGDFANGFVGRRTSYNRTTGVLTLAVEQTFGAGTFNAWEIGPIATTADLEALRDQIVADKAATLAARETAETAAGQANGAAVAANTSKNDAQAALAAFNGIWLGARATEPETSLLGAQYLDTSQTPNVVKVLTADGWAPTVTVSIGGSRVQTYTATEGQTGPFTVDGGFSIGSVVLNGITLHHGNGVTLDPEAGTFTFDIPLAEGDFFAFEGYLANDVTDIYTKAEADALLAPKLVEADVSGRFAKRVRVDAAQSFTEEEQGQARANSGAGILAGFRNKIINGNGFFNQRGVVAKNGYGPDRWVGQQGVGADHQILTAFMDFGPLGYTAGFQWDRSVVGSSESYFIQRIEGRAPIQGGKWTGTVWTYSDVPTVMRMFVQHHYGTGGSPSPDETLFDALIEVPAGYKKHSVVFDAPLVVGKTFGTTTSSYTVFGFYRQTTGPNLTASIRMTDISLVPGDASMEDNPFSPRHIQQELALCQRYYQNTLQASARFYDPVGGGAARLVVPIYFPAMRTNPSISVGTTSAQLNLALTPTANVLTPQSARFEIIGNAVGDTYALGANIVLDAEL